MNKKYRVWEIAHNAEIPLTVTPHDFEKGRKVMHLRSLEVCNRRGWKLDSQGLDFVIYNIPEGKQYELRIRQETPEVNAYEALAGIRYTTDEGALEAVTDYSVDVDRTPTDGLFDREGTYPQAKWEVAENG